MSTRRSERRAEAPAPERPEARAAQAAASPSAERWQAPRIEVVSLACEITAYAPDDTPLF